MSQLEEFLELLKQDRELSEQFAGVTDKESWIALAVKLGQEKGLEFTAADVEEWMSQVESELDDEDLGDAAGGSPHKATSSC